MANFQSHHYLDQVPTLDLEAGGIMSREKMMIKMKSGSLVHWPGLLKAWRNDYNVGDSGIKLHIITSIASIFPTFTIEEVFRLLVGTEGIDFNVYGEDVVFIKTKYYLEKDHG